MAVNGLGFEIYPFGVWVIVSRPAYDDESYWVKNWIWNFCFSSFWDLIEIWMRICVRDH